MKEGADDDFVLKAYIDAAPTGEVHLSRPTTTTIGDIKIQNKTKKRGNDPKPYAPRLAWDSTLLSNYILLTVIVGTRSAHTRQVVAIRRKLACQVVAAYFAQPNRPATSIADDTRAITMPLMEKFPNAT
jgi:hypothetical protein